MVVGVPLWLIAPHPRAMLEHFPPRGISPYSRCKLQGTCPDTHPRCKARTPVGRSAWRPFGNCIQ